MVPARVSLLLVAVVVLVLGLGGAGVPAATITEGLVYAEGERLMLDGEPFVMKGYNYFPRDYGWTSMVDWDWEAVDLELALAREYGANTIRTGFEYGVMTGDPHCESPFTRFAVLPEYADAVDRFLSIAERHDLKVVFWLGAGPCWGALWDPANYGVVEQHLESLIPRFAGDPRIAAWDLATDLDGTMVQAPPLGAYGADPRSTRGNMVTLLANMAGTVHSLDPGHLLTVGFCWPSSSLLVQDFTDFLMPQFLGGDAPSILETDQAAELEYYGFWDEYSVDPEGAVDRLAGKLESLMAGLRRPLPIVLSEYGSPTRGEGFSVGHQAMVYEAVLETALLRLELAGALNWALTDFAWPPLARTFMSGTLPETERSFGIFDIDYAPKPSAAVAAAFYADHPDIRLEAGTAEVDFVFESFFVPGAGDSRRLSAAFDWIEFRNAEGRTILKLDVGAPEARPHLLQGFYADEGPWAEAAENFAWAGGDEQAARVRLPVGAEMVVLRAVANGSMRVDVAVEGAVVGSVTLGPDWGIMAVALPAPEPASVGVAHAVRGSMSLPISGGTVAVQVSYDGTTWEEAGSTVPDRGRFSVPIRFEHGGAAWVRPTWSGAGLYGPATGEPIEVQVAPAAGAVEFSLPPTGLTVGEEAWVGGSFTPAAAGLSITLTLTRPDGSESVQTAITGADGRFEVSLTADQEGDWEVSAAWEGDDDYQAGGDAAGFRVLAAAPATTAASTTSEGAAPPVPEEGGGAGVGLLAGLAGAVAVAGAAGLMLARRRRGTPAR